MGLERSFFGEVQGQWRQKFVFQKRALSASLQRSRTHVVEFDSLVGDLMLVQELLDLNAVARIERGTVRWAKHDRFGHKEFLAPRGALQRTSRQPVQC